MNELNPTYAGLLNYNKPLRKLNSWHIGGVARRYYCPKNIKDLEVFLQSLPRNEQIFWLGLGSNLLIRDGGVAGTVIHTHKGLDKIEVIEQGKNVVLRIEAGVTCSKIARLMDIYRCTGGEFFAGIPGTLGGALAMNAGAFGSSSWDYVLEVEVINKFGYHCHRSPNEFEIGYRSVCRKEHEWFVAGYLFFPVDNSLGSKLKIKQLLQARKQTQPIGLLNCGSVFKNPIGEHAAQLIETSKLKGTSVGGAVVSTKHANFINNVGSATSNDVEQLIQLVQQRVYAKHRIFLEPEVKIIGEKLDG